MSALWREPAPLVLASKSAIRMAILKDAGLPVQARPAELDERAVEAQLSGDGANPANVAGALAVAKAIDVSSRLAGRLVVGADQTLSLDGERFTKPVSRDAGRSQLLRLSGRTHALFSGAAIVRDGHVLWSGVAEVRLATRPLGEDFLDAYLEAAGEGALTSVGGYQFEGIGAQLFERVEGDYFAILGLPLLPVLAALRSLGALAS
ncbi:Maf family protein [Hansschlegelia zhihuaiae]|uniref:Nucleoside triphosphate pyrophosphatase n=1 Tax=Hansschlegelia zhihuaiae TaxID=405005 RepID=A0A4Q0MB22_9HYPH|nr:Maf family protein [Hansschlegelia zhihuaiae]RXF70305.1 septum formation inhibitor Maf [Hansschlegelia zhihuaiae]